MSDLLRLAALIESTPGRLAEVIRERSLLDKRPADLFDLARLLLSRRKLEPVIRALPAHELELLQSGASSARLRFQLLADDSALAAAQQLASELNPGKLELTEHPATELDSYNTLLAVTELIFASERHWLRYQRSGLSLPDAKNLASHLQTLPATLQLQFQLALSAGLFVASSERWVATDRAWSWLNLSNSDRWNWLALDCNDLPPGFVPKAGVLAEQLASEYPLINQGELKILKLGHLLTLVNRGVPTDHLRAICNGDSTAIGSLLPQPEDRLVLHSDLTLTATGPISAELHRELDLFAEAESLGLAARFRISQLSLSHALESGKTIADIEALLANFGEIPQPLRYLLDETVAKFGALQLKDSGSGTQLSCDDKILLAQIANEPSLRSLGLQPNPLGLVSRLPSEIIYFNLREAGYAAVRVDEQGRVRSPRVAATIAAENDEVAASEAMAARLLQVESADANELVRQLKFALKHKLPVELEANLPSGTKTFRLQLLGVTEARIRGRDLDAEAERTLPLTAIGALRLG